MHFFSRGKNYLPLIILFLIELILFVCNYKQGTYFIGWDNLVPEMNILENLQRSFFGTWQEYRGLGFLDGMSFAANLVHYLFIGLLDLILPQNLLRYLFNFFMHLLGGVGIYFLILELLQAYKYKKIASFFGSLFYLFNIATVQMFFIPYEVFTVHFASLPILLLFTIKYIISGSKKHFVWLCILTLLSTPQAHVPTLFIVYGFALFSVLAFYSKLYGKVVFKRSVVVLLLTVMLNAFWAFPYAYSTSQNAGIIANSKINQMGTEDIFRRNQAFGDLLDVVLLRGFALDFIDIETPGTTGYLMKDWRGYAYSPLFTFIGILFFVITLLAGIRIYTTKQKQFYPFILLFIFSFLMLGTTIPILSFVSSVFYNYVPYFFQIFRFTFTKFSLLYAFSFSILFAVGVLVILQFFAKNKILKISIILVLFTAIISSSYPSFKGFFFYPNLKNSIPQEYFTLVDYFKKQDHNTRIALLPQPSFWGWTYNQWGYRGSGFIWFGLPQASLDGAFYPWSRHNENYYWEVTYAIYSGNAELLDTVLEKYDINWVIIDNSIITQLSPKSLYLESLTDLLKKSQTARLSQSFGKINVYTVNHPADTKAFVALTNTLPHIEPGYQANSIDQAYSDVGTYRSDASANGEESDVYYPFRSLFTGKTQLEHEFQVKESENSYSFRFTIPENFANASLYIPAVNIQDVQEIDIKNTTPLTPKIPEIKIGGATLYPKLYTGDNTVREAPVARDVTAGESVEIMVPKINGYFSYNSKTADDLFSRKATKCINTLGQSSFETVKVDNQKVVRLTAENTDLCYDIYLPNLPQRLAYISSIESRNTDGRPFIFWLENQNSKKSDIETYLSDTKEFKTNYFIQPAMEYYGLGYTLHLQSHAIGQEKTVNEVRHVEIHPFPYNLLTSMKVTNTLPTKNQQFYSNFDVKHPNPSLYYVNLSTNPLPETLFLSQSYHTGWKAYVVDGWLSRTFPVLFGKELKEHMLINNWANGWRIDRELLPQDGKQATIAIFFVPQLLEYIGFALLPVPFIYVFWPKRKKKEK